MSACLEYALYPLHDPGSLVGPDTAPNSVGACQRTRHEADLDDAMGLLELSEAELEMVLNDTEMLDAHDGGETDYVVRDADD